MLTTTTIQMLLSKIEAAHKERDTQALDSLFVAAYGLCNPNYDSRSMNFERLATMLDVANKLSDHDRFTALLEVGLAWATATESNRAAAWAEVLEFGKEKVKP